MQISIKAARVNAGLTQRELAKRMGKCVNSIINWENGNTKIKLEDFKKLCKILNVNENQIFLDNKLP